MASGYARGRSRRIKNEINMVPFIDVMLVLLIIFMVTAPLISPSQIEVPSVGQANERPKAFVSVSIDKDEIIQVGEGNSKDDGREIKIDQLAEEVKALQTAAATDGIEPSQVPVVISADKSIKYETVVKTMDTLQRAGMARIGLSVQTTR
jgi:biopolymer transport protein TolR